MDYMIHPTGSDRFPLGQIVATPAALEALGRNGQTALQFLSRHAAGDWGEVLGTDDCEANDQALIQADRLLSAYFLKDGERLWVITEWDRSVTTVLLPDDY